MSKLIYFISILLCLGACSPGHNDYSEYKNIPTEGWRYSKVLSFPVAHVDSISKGALIIGLRHGDDYPYSNIWVEVEYNDLKTGLRKDTLNIKLSDKYGNWLGKGNATKFQIIDTVNSCITHLNNSPVRVRHIMRVDTLIGIDLVGVVFEPNDSKRHD